jgi:uncharacterized caspase-like protein
MTSRAGPADEPPSIDRGPRTLLAAPGAANLPERRRTWVPVTGRYVSGLVRLALALAVFAAPQSGPAYAAVVRLDDIPRVDRPARAADIAAVVEELRAMPPLRTAAAKGQARRALVIGVNDYAELTDLNKAEGDARSIEATLKDLGFQVTVKHDVTARDFDDAVDEFVASLKRGDVAFFFFAGHGVSYEQRNFLLPADMPALDAVRESRLERYAVDAQDLVDRIYGRGVEIAFIVLDACRDNPFPPDADTRAVRAYGGLARMTPQKGTFVLYSACIGQKALDRLGPDDTDPNSVFTRTFRPILATPGMPAVEIAKRTQVEVHALAATVPHQQDPAYYDQVVGQFYLKAPTPKLYGLVIGIDDYGGRFDLKGAVNDARQISAKVGAAGAEKVVTILDEDARLSFIDYVWNDLVEDADPGDTIMFTFSGQGTQEAAGAKTGEKDGLRDFLILPGSTPLDGYADFRLFEEERKLTDDIFTEWMAAAARKNVNVIVLIDGCHAGGLLDREFANVSFFAASQEHETAQERRFDGVQQGLASYVFSQALSGAADLNRDGYITQRELFAFGDENVFHMSAGRQNPTFYPSVANSSAGLVLLSVGGPAVESTLSRYWKDMPGVPKAEEPR